AQAHIKAIRCKYIIWLLDEAGHQAIVNAAIPPYTLDQRTSSANDNTSFGDYLGHESWQTCAQLNACITYFHQYLSTAGDHHTARAWRADRTRKDAKALCHKRALHHSITFLHFDHL